MYSPRKPHFHLACVFEGVYANQPKEFIERYDSQVPLKRMAYPEDIKGIIAYLASDLSEYVTGQNFVIDGGWSV